MNPSKCLQDATQTPLLTGVPTLHGQVGSGFQIQDQLLLLTGCTLVLFSANNTLYYCLSTCSVSTDGLALATSAPHERFLATMVGTEHDSQAGSQRRCQRILRAEQPFQLCGNPGLVRDMIIKSS